ncbi:MAG: hypothetical protein H6868_09830 [Rhodospirillales bacterium]|nr:hypothetical protein [Rhodospirillales bacterium]
MEFFTLIVFATVIWFVYNKRQYLLTALLYKSRELTANTKKADVSSWDQTRCIQEITDNLMILIMKAISLKEYEMDDWEFLYSVLFKYYLIIRENRGNVPVVTIAFMYAINELEAIESGTACKNPKVIKFCGVALTEFMMPKAIPASQKLIKLYGGKLSEREQRNAVQFVNEFKTDISRITEEVTNFTEHWRHRQSQDHNSQPHETYRT